MGCSKSSDRAAGPASASASARPSASERAGATAADDDPSSGSQLDEQEFDSAVTLLPPSALEDPPTSHPALPPRAMLQNLPTVATQGMSSKRRGTPGSCEAQSFGRGLGTYTAARAVDGHALWDATKPENEISAAFLYAWAHKLSGKACPKGTKALPYLSRLVSKGAPSAADVPYKPDCSYLDGTTYLDAPHPDEQRFRIGSFATMHLGPDKLVLVKELLAAGQALAFSGQLIKGYNDPTLESGVLYAKEVVPKSGHGQLLIGYDDTIGAEGKKGSFLVQNSEGDDWPPSAPGGRIWIAYDAFLETQKLAATAYPRDPSPPSGQMLTVKAGPSTAPAASVTRSYPWEAESGTFLVLLHHFAEPVLFRSLEMKDPSGKVVTSNVGQYMQSGYTHLRRPGTRGFPAGKWTVTIEAQTLAGEDVAYTGTVTLAKGKHSSGTLAAPISGSTGKPATVL
jgi:hypothetical protein